MKKTRFFLFVLTIATLLLSACGGVAATPNSSGGRPQPIPVAFVGVVDSMAGNQWVINGNTVTVDPAVIRDGPFNVGDPVKVEGIVNSNGTFTVSRVEAPTPEDLSSLPSFGDNSNDANVNDANTNDGNINDDNGNGANTNDDDDNSNAANSNDDDNNANSNDDDSNSNDNNNDDDNSGSGGNDNNGGGDNNDNDDGDDDNGGGGNDNDDD